MDLCTYSQYNAYVKGRLERFNDRTSCKINKWFLEGADANSAWYKADIPFGKQILPKTANNQGNLVIGLNDGIVSLPALKLCVVCIVLISTFRLDSHHHPGQGQCSNLQNEGGNRGGVHI